jgi:pimeloyl-ACP methyl ester carboxylesterase
MKIVYIHGASATGDSFNYIRSHLSQYTDIVVQYDSNNGFFNNLELLKQQLQDESKLFFIGHSLGGIYALHLYHEFQEKIMGAVTISTPYGGAESADYTKYILPFNRLLRDIGPNSTPFRELRDVEVKIPWTNIVTTAGKSPWIIQDNDGVVTIKSQKFRTDIDYVEIAVNHYEVVLSDEVVEIIKNKLSEIS